MATDKETNIVQNICLTEQSFLNKITTGCLWNFSFIEVSMHFVATFSLHSRIQFLKDSLVVAMESFSIELTETIAHKCSKKGVYEMLQERIRKHPQQNTTSDNSV